jgi:hypothetical protein
MSLTHHTVTKLQKRPTQMMQMRARIAPTVVIIQDRLVILRPKRIMVFIVRKAAVDQTDLGLRGTVANPTGSEKESMMSAGLGAS